MTNLQLISTACAVNGVFTEEFIVDTLESFGELPIHTFAVWKERGYSVKRGEHARLKVELWRHNDRRHTEAQQEAANVDPETATEGTEGTQRATRAFYKKLCYMFTADQVEPIGKR